MEVSGQLQAPAVLPRGKSTMCQLDSRLTRPQSRSGCCGEKSLIPAGSRTPAVQPVARRYTVGRISWKEDQPVIRSLHRADKHPYLELDLKPDPSVRRHFVPVDHVVTVIGSSTFVH
jgi:hypothetical protein